MQIYMGINIIYGFDRWKMLMARYMARNNRSSQEYKGHDKKSMGQRFIISKK